MKCQSCGRYDANFHYTSNINGDVTEQHLCSECAERMGYNEQYIFSRELDIDNMFREMLGARRGVWPAFGINMPRFVSVMPQMGILKSAEPTIASTTTPDVGVEVDEDMKKRRELNILREEMRKAAENEDFERAIELREELRKYEE